MRIARHLVRPFLGVDGVSLAGHQAWLTNHERPKARKADT